MKNFFRKLWGFIKKEAPVVLPIAIQISEQSHVLQPGEGIVAHAQDGSKIVVQNKDGVAHITAYESTRKPIRGVMPR